MIFSSEIHKVLQQLKPHRRRLVGVAVAGILVAAIDTATANMTKQIFDGVEKGNLNIIKETFAIIIGLAFFKGIFRFLHIYNMNVTAEEVSQGLREKLQAKFLRLNLGFYNQYASGSGGLITRILSDITVIQNGLRMFADFFREPFLFVGLMGSLFYLNYRLTISIIVVLPLVLFFLRTISKSIKKYSLKGQEELERITSTIKESLDGVRTIQSFNLEDHMTDRFKREGGIFIKSRKKIHGLIESSGPTTEFIMTLLIFSIILFMTVEITKGRASLGDFMSYVACLLMLSAPIKKLQESYVRIQETSVSAKRIFDIIDNARTVSEPSNPKSFPADWSEIKFSNLDFRYDQEPILKNISLTVKRGQMVAFVGPSGSGKSTLLNLLGRFFEPTQGSISIGGIQLDEFSLNELRAKIALVSQDVFLFSDSIEQNIWAGDFTKSKEKLADAASRSNVNAFADLLSQGLNSQVGERGSLLSGGEKQRVSLARAFLKDSPILILDEATSSLDAGNEQEIQKGLEELIKGRTTFVVAHRLSTIEKADVIYVLNKGVIVEQGKHKDLLALKGLYHDLCLMQNITT